MTRHRLPYLAGAVISLVVVLLPVQSLVPVQLSLLEAIAVVSYAWSTWLLAKNQPVGWWVGLVGCAAYAVVFYQVRLFAEAGIQAFYFVTSLQAIYIWLHGGSRQSEKSVGHVDRRWLVLILILGLAGTLGVRAVLIEWRGAAPFWDAFTTVFSLIAHLLLMGRYLETWYLWIIVDAIYIPLNMSRGLYLTGLLYAVFLWMAVEGLLTFRRTYRQQHARASLSMR